MNARLTDTGSDRRRNCLKFNDGLYIFVHRMLVILYGPSFEDRLLDLRSALRLRVKTFTQDSLAEAAITFDDEDGEETTVAVTGGRVKLQWKPDFGARWAALGIDFEMFGKDHGPNMGLYDRICEALADRLEGVGGGLEEVLPTVKHEGLVDRVRLGEDLLRELARLRDGYDLAFRGLLHRVCRIRL